MAAGFGSRTEVPFPPDTPLLLMNARVVPPLVPAKLPNAIGEEPTGTVATTELESGLVMLMTETLLLPLLATRAYVLAPTVSTETPSGSSPTGTTAATVLVPRLITEAVLSVILAVTA